MIKKSRKATKSSRVRFSSLRTNLSLLLIILIAGLFGVRLVDIQVVQAAELNELSKGKRAVPVTIPSLRGDIVDRNGAVLATTEELYDVQISPKNAAASTAFPGKVVFPKIAEITGQKVEEIQKIADDALAENPDSDFAYVKRGIRLDQLNKLAELNVPWMAFDYHFERLYPNGAVGGNIIGFSGMDATPLAGIEYSMHECLQGVDGAETYEKGADGVALPGSRVVVETAKPGGSVELTIDLDLQWQTQQIVDERKKQYGAEWVMAVVMDVKTAELLAVAEDESVDPGNVGASEPSRQNARSFIEPFEPGSTFKALTVAALLDQGKATPYTPLDTPWKYEVDQNVKFSDSYVHDVQPWTMTGIFVNSSNVGTALLGTQLSPEKRYEYFERFGVTEATNAGMPLESGGVLAPWENWDNQTNYNTTFGQGVSSTIIQTAGVFQTIGNEGVRIPPSIVKGCNTRDGKFVKHEAGEPVKAISKEAAETTMNMLETVVTESWWTDSIALPKYRIGGKTGTSEQPDGKGGYREDFVHSFAGVFPVDDPQYVVVAAIGFPADYSSGTLNAIKMVGEISEVVVRTMKVAPSKGKPKPYPVFY